MSHATALVWALSVVRWILRLIWRIARVGILILAAAAPGLPPPPPPPRNQVEQYDDDPPRKKD
jgi:hypothetical protein